MAAVCVLGACTSDAADTSDSSDTTAPPDTTRPAATTPPGGSGDSTYATECQPPVFDGGDPPWDFKNLDYTACDFSGQDLTKAYFDSADLSGVSFRGATLTEVVFNQADVSGADFTGATMVSAYVTGANVENADFTDADMTAATIVSLQGADSATWTGTTCPGDRDGPTGPCMSTLKEPDSYGS